MILIFPSISFVGETIFFALPMPASGIVQKYIGEIRTFSHFRFIHFQQLIRPTKNCGGKKELTREKSREFLRSSAVKCVCLRFQSANENVEQFFRIERAKESEEKLWWKNNLSYFKFLDFKSFTHNIRFGGDATTTKWHHQPNDQRICRIQFQGIKIKCGFSIWMEEILIRKSENRKFQNPANSCKWNESSFEPNHLNKWLGSSILASSTRIISMPQQCLWCCVCKHNELHSHKFSRLPRYRKIMRSMMLLFLSIFIGY